MYFYILYNKQNFKHFCGEYLILNMNQKWARNRINELLLWPYFNSIFAGNSVNKYDIHFKTNTFNKKSHYKNLQYIFVITILHYMYMKKAIIYAFIYYFLLQWFCCYVCCHCICGVFKNFQCIIYSYILWINSTFFIVNRLFYFTYWL